MRTPSIPKEEVLARLTEVFRKVGYEGATLSELSKATGLQRASLYHYFPGGKEEMAHAVLNDLGGIFQKAVLEPLESKGKAETRLKRMTDAVDAFYAGGKLNCLTGLFALSSAHELFQSELGESIALWAKALAVVAIETGIKPATARMKAEDWIAQLQGSLILSRGMNSNAAFKRVLNELPKQLLDKVN